MKAVSNGSTDRARKPILTSSEIMFKGLRLRVERRTFSEKGRRDSAHASDVINFPIAKSVGILPITNKRKILLERHYRYAPLLELLEIPAGWIEKGERPIEAARRELKEETGFVAKKIAGLGSIIPASGYSAEELYLFLARISEEEKNNQALERGEIISLVSYSKAQVLKMIKSGRITDVMTISAMFRASLKGLI